MSSFKAKDLVIILDMPPFSEGFQGPSEILYGWPLRRRFSEYLDLSTFDDGANCALRNVQKVGYFPSSASASNLIWQPNTQKL